MKPQFVVERGHNSWLFSCKILWTEEACFARNNVWLWFQHDGLPARYGENSQRCLNRHVREGELVVEGWLHGLHRPPDLNRMAPPPHPPMETSEEHVNPVCSKNIDFTVTRFRTAVTTDCAVVLWRISRGMRTARCLLITNGLGSLGYLL